MRAQAAVAIPGLGEAVASLLRAGTGLVDEILRMDRELKAISIASPACQALMSIPGVGVQTSAAFAVTCSPSCYRSDVESVGIMLEG